MYHFVDMAVVQSWLLYRRDSDAMMIAKNEQQSLLQFKTEIAATLCRSTTSRKRGRRSLDQMDVQNEEKRRKGGSPVLPPAAVRRDGLNHWPSHDTAPRRYRVPGCKGQSAVIYTKCTSMHTKAYLCFKSTRNCIMKFHQ